MAQFGDQVSHDVEHLLMALIEDAGAEDKKVVRPILDHLGIPATGPPMAPPRPRAQAELFS